MTVINRPTRFLTALLAIVFALAIAGCGDDEGNDQAKTYGETPVGQEQKVTVPPEEEFNADQQAVIETIATFADATQQKDYATICNEVFTAESAKLGGGECEDFLKVANKDFKDFDIEIKTVTIGEDGKTATVKSVTTTDGKPSEVPYSLIKGDDGTWQIAILGQ